MVKIVHKALNTMQDDIRSLGIKEEHISDAAVML